MKNSDEFLSCDWGTSSFRLRLVNPVTFEVLAEQTSKQGIADTFKKWKETGRPEDERLSFYSSILKYQISQLETAAGKSLTGLPLIISGMATSTIGMMNLPYKMIPFAIDGSDLISHTIDASEPLDNPIFLISGVRSNDDVMRGEETQLIGCMLPDNKVEQLFIHPGTHSKHVFVREGNAVTFKTYMTGEVFAVLSKQSILARSVVAGADLHKRANMKSFEQGLKDIRKGNLLHDLFRIRTNDLFKKLSLEENYFYLSGLLIGTELQAFPSQFEGRVILAGEDLLIAHYQQAMELMGITNLISDLSIMKATEITVRGQLQVYKRFKNRQNALS